WEFLTHKKWLGLEADRLTVTVYRDDDEAYNIWHDEIGLESGRIRRDDEHENFWPAGAPSDGPDGVCGPCSEIFFHPPTGGKEVEIWNLVFTQFERVGNPPDNLRPLPRNNIDTGMGLERTAAVLQGKVSNFEIDILRPLCEAAGEAVGVKYEFDAPQGRPLRRIADHIRAVTFSVHEGVDPGSEK
ncbi:MAG: alanine--tRNA ligase, partial [Planctomycetaceae bacterium]|nr:alanine--tRNA ligase [Planctomycetaceae bacterium]